MAGVGFDPNAQPAGYQPTTFTAPTTSVAQPLPDPTVDHSGEYNTIEVRPRADNWTPAQKLEFYVHQREMKRSAEDVEFKRALDEHSVTVAGADQENLQQHIARMGEKLGEIHQKLSGAPPPRQMPQQTVGTMLGEGIAGLFGGGRGFSQALAAGGDVSQQQENVRYANVRTADDAKRAVLEEEANATQREIERGEGVQETMRREKVDAAAQAAEIASREKIEHEKAEIEGKRYEEQWKASQARLNEQEKRDRETARAHTESQTRLTKGQLEAEAGNLTNITPEMAKSYDDQIDALNAERKLYDLPPLGYLAKGERVRAATLKETIARDQDHVTQFDARQAQHVLDMKQHHDDLMTILHSTNARFGQGLDFQKTKLAWEESGGKDTNELEQEAFGQQAAAQTLAAAAEAADKRGDSTEAAKLRTDAAKATANAAKAAAAHVTATKTLEHGKLLLDAPNQRKLAGAAMAKLPGAAKAEFRALFNKKYAEAIKAGNITKL